MLEEKRKQKYRDTFNRKRSVDSSLDRRKPCDLSEETGLEYQQKPSLKGLLGSFGLSGT